MSQPQIYCSICGAPIFEGGTLKNDPKEWLTTAVLLTTGHNVEQGIELDTYWPRPPRTSYSFHQSQDLSREPQRSVLRLEAHSHGTESFDLLDSGAQVNAMRVDIQPRKLVLDHGAPLYLPVHRFCIQLTDRFIDRVTSSIHTAQIVPLDGITSPKQMWEVLYRRLRGSSSNDRTWILPEPHDYFGGRRCRNTYWEPGDDSEYAELLEQNPIEIPSLTSSILQNLRQADMIDPVGVPRHLRTSQDWYCEALVNKQIFPWLWDMDLNAVRKKQRAGRWDWELLVRQLSQREIQDLGGTALQLSLQPRNRRRIWRLLEEARVGDIARPEEKLMAARLSGEKRGSALAAVSSALSTDPQLQTVPGFRAPNQE